MYFVFEIHSGCSLYFTKYVIRTYCVCTSTDVYFVFKLQNTIGYFVLVFEILFESILHSAAEYKCKLTTVKHCTYFAPYCAILVSTL